MENLDYIKNLSQDAENIENYFNEYPYSINEYLTKYPKSTVDKYENEFNGDGRFSAIDMEIFFSSKIGTYGDSSCTCILDINNKVVFQDAFVDYLNSHRKEIFAYIAQRYKDKIKENIKAIDDEIDELADIKKQITL